MDAIDTYIAEQEKELAEARKQLAAAKFGEKYAKSQAALNSRFVEILSPHTEQCVNGGYRRIAAK